MKKYRHTYQPNSTTMPPLPKGSLFLDIETTGFQRNSTFLTILGLAWQEEEQIIIEQWLNDIGAQEEPLLLLELESFLKDHPNFSNLIHYNGTTFDLPYLKVKYEQYHLPSRLSQFTPANSIESTDFSSVDLYHLAKKYRHLLHLSGLKQKNLEEAFGLYREDQLSGQKLIQVYQESLRKKDPSLMDSYLLHNREDMEGMVFLQQLIRLDSFFHGDFQILDWTICNAPAKKETPSAFSPKGNASLDISKERLHITLSGKHQILPSLSCSIEGVSCLFEKEKVFLEIPVCSMEARYFYANYKDYYYLPTEDRAIHKSVASFVEKEFRQKATKETCYTKKEALFLPLFLPEKKSAQKDCLEDCSSFHLFYQKYGDKTAWILKEELTASLQPCYLKWLLSFILASQSPQ